MALTIVDFNEKYFPSLLGFLDKEIGENYFNREQLEKIILKSTKAGINCSLLLVDDSDKVLGARITYPPGNWSSGRGENLSPHLWKTKIEETAYFQSLFVDSSLTGQGWGAQLSLESMSRLRKLGSKAIVCHSWVQSPHGSSARYLAKLGFIPLVRYPNYWSKVNYRCSVCGDPPCRCTAEECILYLEAE